MNQAFVIEVIETDAVSIEIILRRLNQAFVIEVIETFVFDIRISDFLFEPSLFNRSYRNTAGGELNVNIKGLNQAFVIEVIETPLVVG